MAGRVHAGLRRGVIGSWAITLFVLVGMAAHAAAGPATAPAVVVRVTHVISDRFPSLSDDDVARVLNIASEMIAAGYHREVRFVPAKEAKQTSADFFGAMDRRILPYRLAPAEHFDVFAGKLDDAAPAFRQAVQHADDLAHLHQFLGYAEPFADEASAARALTKVYGDRLAKLKALRTPAGKPRLDQATYSQSSLAQWEVYLGYTGPNEQYDLILSNGLLIEEPIQTASFHTLATATANGLAYVVSNNCVVGYGALLSGDADIRADHLGALAPAERLLAIAYVVAHEVGTHLVMLRYDDYAADAGLARPILVVKDKSEIAAYRSWTIPTARPRPVDLLAFRCAITRTRIGIAAARADSDALFKELDVLEGLPVSREWKDGVAAWAGEVANRAHP